LGNLRILLSLLLVSSVLLLFNGPGASSQALTTLTSTHNITSTTVITTYSTIQSTSTTQELIHYASWPYDYDNSTATFSLWQVHNKLVRLEFGDWEDVPCLYYDYFVFNATAGQEIKGQFTTEQGRSVGFYVLNPAQFRIFGYSGCQGGNWPWDVYVFGPTYDLNWRVPESGPYVFLFLSWPFYGGHIHFTAQAYSTVESASVSTYMITSMYTLQSTEILLSTQTTTSIPNSTPRHDLLLVAILIIAILILAASFLLKARGKSLRLTLQNESSINLEKTHYS
jgi:hypothetical protein